MDAMILLSSEVGAFRLGDLDFLEADLSGRPRLREGVAVMSGLREPLAPVLDCLRGRPRFFGSESGSCAGSGDELEASIARTEPRSEMIRLDTTVGSCGICCSRLSVPRSTSAGYTMVDSKIDVSPNG